MLISGCKSIFTIENKHENYLEGKHYAEISVKNYGKIELELDADKAPITVTNFMKLVNEGYYENNKFHRIAKDFVIQGGEGEKQADTIKGEFEANKVNNDISHVRGTISMARSGDTASGFDTASSQFFIVQKDSTFLDGYYAGFGKVTKGMDVVDKIVKKVTKVDDNGQVINEKDMPIIEYIKEIEK
jgi:peptidyl-prolyl cis-trans isomerase B (cyclophilin B)